MDTKILRNLLGGLVGFAFLGAVGAANAATVTDTSGFNTPISVINFSQYAFCTDYGSAPCQNQDVGGLVGESVLFTGTNGFLGASLYNAEFGLGSNGSWDSGRNGYVGINNQQGGSGIFAEFEFAQGLSDVGAFVNYGPGIGGTPLMQVFDINHVLLETFSVSVAAPIATTGTNNGAFRGFSRASDDIYFIRFTDGFTVLDDLSFARSGAQPTVFSIIVIPDTQMYVEAHPEVFEAQMDWIVANQVEENIIYVAHLGDLKDDLSCDNKLVRQGSGANLANPLGRYEWQIVDEALTILDDANIPYGVVPGNHDFEQLRNDANRLTCPTDYSCSVDGGGVTENEQCEQRPLGTDDFLAVPAGNDYEFTNFNEIIGPSRFSDVASNGYQPTYGDTDSGSEFFPTSGNRSTATNPNSNEDNFSLIEFGGVKLIVINLGYREDPNAVDPDDGTLCISPNNPEIQWADDLLGDYPDRLGIVTSHYFVNEVTSSLGPSQVHGFNSYGRCIYAELSDNQNLIMMLSAHEFGEGWRRESSGRGSWPPVQALLSDYQRVNYPDPAVYTGLSANNSFGDAGFIRIMRFDIATGLVNITTLAPEVSFIDPEDELPYTYSPSTIHNDHWHFTNTGLRPGLTSTYCPDYTVGGDGLLDFTGAGMGRATASNLCFSFWGYRPGDPAPSVCPDPSVSLCPDP